jgi:hypothetical protein
LGEANAMRALKRQLTALGDESAKTAIAGRLIELGRAEQDAPACTGPGLALWHPSRWRWRGRRDRPFRPGRARSRQVRSTWVMTAGSAGTAAVTIGFAAFLLGNAQSDRPALRVTPSVDSYLRQHAYDAGQVGVSNSRHARPAPSLDNPGELDIGWHGRAEPGPAQFGIPQPVTTQARPAEPKSGQLTARPGQMLPALAAPSASATPIPGPAQQPPGSHQARHSPR